MAQHTHSAYCSVSLDLHEDYLSVVLTILPLETVAQCAASCKALDKVVALASTWRVLCMSMLACGGGIVPFGVWRGCCVPEQRAHSAHELKMGLAR